MTVVGLHGRADGPLQDADFEVITTARIAVVKLLSTAAGADVDRLGREHPDIRIIVRCFADFRGRVITAADFARSMAGDLVPFYQRGIREYEIHNEPNLRDEGWGASWADGAGFGAWFSAVRLALSNTFPGCSWGWPGLSPGITDGQRTDSEQFMAAAGSHVDGADWIGQHCYWIDEQTYADAVHQVQLVHARFPGKPIYVTEFANQSAAPAADKAQQYLRFYRDLTGLAEVAFAFVASASSPDFETQAWRDESGRLSAIPQIVGARPKEAVMAADIPARGQDVAGDNQPVAKMRYADWAKLGFCYGWVEWIRSGAAVKDAGAHRAAMRTERYLTGAYANLAHGNAGAQCLMLLSLLNGAMDDELGDMLDCENGNLAAGDVIEWCDTHDAETHRRLDIYTSAARWLAIMRGVPAATLARFKRYGLVIAGYPFDTPADAQGVDHQPMDAASVARRSTPPALSKLASYVPAPWTVADVISWQHTGHGSLPGYNGFLDLHVATVTQSQLRARFGAAAPAPVPDPAVLALAGAQAAQAAVAQALELLA